MAYIMMSVFTAKTAHKNTCQSDNLFRGFFCAERYASTKRHPTNCRCTLRYVSEVIEW